MVRSAELAERLDVRLHTHFAENAEDDEFSLATFGCRPTDYLERTGWLTDRAWLAHCVMPDPDEVAPPRGGRRRRRPLPVEQPDPGVGHRPGRRPAGRRRARRARRRRLVVGRRGVAVAGGPPGDAAGQAARRRRRRHGAHGAGDGDARRRRLPRARPASSACSRPARSATSPCGRSTGPAFAGAIADPVEALAALRSGRRPAHDRARPRRRARRALVHPASTSASPPTAVVASRLRRPDRRG